MLFKFTISCLATVTAVAAQGNLNFPGGGPGPNGGGFGAGPAGMPPGGPMGGQGGMGGPPKEVSSSRTCKTGSRSNVNHSSLQCNQKSFPTSILSPRNQNSSQQKTRSPPPCLRRSQAKSSKD